MDDTDPLAETIAYVALQRLQSRYADAVTRRAWSELASLVRADCPIVVDVRHKKFELTGPSEYGEFIARQIERFSLFEFVLLNTVMRIDVVNSQHGDRSDHAHGHGPLIHRPTFQSQTSRHDTSSMTFR